MDIEALRTDTAAAELHPACITLLHTQGTGSFELYAGHLAKRVAPSYPTRFYLETIRRYRDAPLMIIGEGTNEIQKLVIARRLLERYAI